MSFTARYPGHCGFCDEQMQGTQCSFASDDVLVHVGCLTPYATGINPVATAIHRNEQRCSDCFLIHAGECP